MSNWTEFTSLLQRPEYQELEDSGFFCPISGLSLRRVVRYCSDDGQLAYIVEKDGSVDKIYMVEKKLPYFRLVMDRSDPRSTDPRANRWDPNCERFEERYWLITPNGWKQYKRHVSWKLLEPVFLPVDFPEEEVNKIIDQVSDSQFPVSTTWAFPMIQKVAAKTIGLNLVSVQPMSAPTGTLFYLDSIYGRKKSNHRRKKRSNRSGYSIGRSTRVYVPKGRRRRYNPTLPFLFKKSRMERTHKRRTCSSNNR